MDFFWRKPIQRMCKGLTYLQRIPIWYALFGIQASAADEHRLIDGAL